MNAGKAAGLEGICQADWSMVETEYRTSRRVLAGKDRLPSPSRNARHSCGFESHETTGNKYWPANFGSDNLDGIDW
jgi:hypothetical protein